MALIAEIAANRWFEDALVRWAFAPPPPPHYCGRCMVLFSTRGDYILHGCGGPPGGCLDRIGREPFGVVYPGGGPIAGPEDFGFTSPRKPACPTA